MVQYAQECSTLGIRYIWDPGQQCARMDGAQLAEGVTGAFMVIVNDYEFELLRQKTGMGEDEILTTRCEVLVDHARRERARSVLTEGPRVDVPAVPPARIEDPTGVGDAFRGGFMKGLASGASYEVCARGSAAWPPPTRSSISAARATPTREDEFTARYEKHFGPLELRYEAGHG